MRRKNIMHIHVPRNNFLEYKRTKTLNVQKTKGLPIRPRFFRPVTVTLKWTSGGFHRRITWLCKNLIESTAVLIGSPAKSENQSGPIMYFCCVINIKTASQTYLDLASSNLPTVCIWNIKSPPPRYSMTKNRWSCTKNIT